MSKQVVLTRSRSARLSPLVQQVLDKLMDKMAELQAGEPLPTEIELAESFGVSRKTLRAAMHEIEVKGAIQRVRGKGTFPTQGKVARAIFRSQAVQLGMVNWAGNLESRDTGDFYAQILQGATEEAMKRRCHIVFSGGSACNERAEACYRLCDSARVEALILVALTDQALLEDLAARGKPVCLVDHWSDRAPVDTVRVDSASGSRQGMEHLFQLGHERVAFLDTPYAGTNVLRRQGYEKAMQARRLAVRPEWIVPAKGADAVEGGGQAALQLLSLPEADRPTGMLAFSDEIALGAIQAIMRFGMRVPGDISVVGFGGVKSPLTVGLPKLTSVRFDSAELGRYAVQFLLDRLDQPGLEPRNVMIPSRLDLGDSAGSCRK